MAKYELLIKPSAVKEIEELPRKDRARVTRKIQQLAGEPRPHGSEKLSVEEKYRVRQGNYRIVYSIDDDKCIILVVKVGHRKEVYRWLVIRECLSPLHPRSPWFVPLRLSSKTKAETAEGAEVLAKERRRN